MSVNTLLGPVPSEDLGRTLMHEHIFTLLTDLHEDAPTDDAALERDALRRLADLAEHGFGTLVDLTVIGLGRSIRRLLPIARQSPIHIVPATGIYTFNDLPKYFQSGTRDAGEDFVSRFLVREIEDGIGTSGVRAGVIKFAVDAAGVTPDLDILIRQSGQAQLRTGVPISTHSHAATRQGLAQQRILREEGVDLDRVVIGHSGDTMDYGYLEQLIENGSWLGMDRFGVVDNRLSLTQRIEVVAEMCRRGYADRMVLSHDTNVASDSIVPEVRSRPEYSNWNYCCVADIVIPELRRHNVSQADIDLMTISNPAAILDIR